MCSCSIPKIFKALILLYWYIWQKFSDVKTDVMGWWMDFWLSVTFCQKSNRPLQFLSTTWQWLKSWLIKSELKLNTFLNAILSLNQNRTSNKQTLFTECLSGHATPLHVAFPYKQSIKSHSNTPSALIYNHSRHQTPHCAVWHQHHLHALHMFRGVLPVPVLLI